MKHLHTTLVDFITESNVVQSDEFKRWFDNSAMVERNGEPMVFYHGSEHEFDQFDPEKIGTATDPGWLGTGFYFYTDIHEAGQYGKVSEYYLCIKDPYYASDEDNEYLAEQNSVEASTEFTNRLIQDGHDGVYYNGNLRGETVVFHASQIWKINN